MTKINKTNYQISNEIIISNYEGKKLAKLKDSSFLISAIGDNDIQAIQNLKESYRKFLNRLENSD